MVRIEGLKTTFKVDMLGRISREHERIVRSLPAAKVIDFSNMLANKGYYVVIHLHCNEVIS